MGGEKITDNYKKEEGKREKRSEKRVYKK